jgi:DNA mismatch endonuclease (patch repair protein)
MPGTHESCNKIRLSHTSALGGLFIADEWEGMQEELYEVGSGLIPSPGVPVVGKGWPIISRGISVTDVFDRAKRSQVMSRIKSKGTSVEETLYVLIRKSLGPRWRIDRNVDFLPGRPDIVIPSLKIVVFAHGCFYHSCMKHGHIPKSNTEYWAPKLENNCKRDRRNRRRLRALGFSVWTIWEHDLEGGRVQRSCLVLGRRLAQAVRAKAHSS